MDRSNHALGKMFVGTAGVLIAWTTILLVWDHWKTDRDTYRHHDQAGAPIMLGRRGVYRG